MPTSRPMARDSALCFLCLSGLLCLLAFCSRAQQPPVDAGEISRDLLYHPARRVDATEQGLLLRAARFTYRFDRASGQWEVHREKNFAAAEATPAMKSYKSARLNAEYRFVARSTDDEATLEIRRGPEESSKAEHSAPLVLWKRKQLAAAWLTLLRQDASSLTVEQLARDLEVADPGVTDVTDDGSFLWLAIRHSAGEGELGIGTLVRFDLQTNEAKAYQPVALATSSVTHIVAAGGELWLGTLRFSEGTIYATKGLVRFNPHTGEVRSYLPESSPLIGRVVTALRAERDLLWVATDAGMCRIALPKEEWTCWRIAPTVRLAAPTPVSNRSGAPPGGRLPPGTYEVRWANAAFLEVITPDSIEGWMAADDLQDYARRNFESDPYELENPSAGGIAAMRLLENPGSDPLTGAQVHRAPLTRVGSPSSDGWQRVRAHVGWISRKDLEVVPVIEPVSSRTAPPR